MIKEISGCRLCGHRSFSEVVDFRTPRPTQMFFKSRTATFEVSPLTVVRCKRCLLVQLGHSMLLDRGPSLAEYDAHKEVVQDELVRKVCSAVAFEAEDRVLDIDCGDGALLERYPHHVLTVGCDTDKASIVDALEAKRLDVGIIGSFRRASAFENAGKFKVITALGSLTKVEDPKTFIEDCVAVLADDGLLILQQPYLKSIVEDTAFDQFDFGFKTYWSLATLERLLATSNFEIVGVDPVSDGSVRVYAMRLGRRGLDGMALDKQMELYTRVKSMMMAEQMVGLEGDGIYQHFRRSMIGKIAAVQMYLVRQKKKGARIYAYGASARNIGLLHSLALPEGFLTGVVDVHVDAQYEGRLVGGMWAPIVLAVEKATHLLVLPYYWQKEVELREFQWLAMGGTMVYPLPVPSTMRENVATELAVPASGGLVKANEAVISN